MFLEKRRKVQLASSEEDLEIRQGPSKRRCVEEVVSDSESESDKSDEFPCDEEQ